MAGEFEFEFPEPEREVIVETGMMQRTVRRTMAVHRGCAIVVWTGPSRIGKTKTAEWMVRKAQEAYARSAHGFRIVHYEVGEIDGTGHAMKRGIRSLYHATVGKLPETAYRQLPAEDLAAQLVHGLQAKNIKMVLIDEAGLLSLDAIRGMVLVRDVAENMRWDLTLVFIGMDDLPTKMSRLPQIRKRIHDWCYFQPYTLEETHELMAQLDPHFAALDLDDALQREQVEFVHEQFGGLPGMVVPFLRRVSHRRREMEMPVDLTFLRAVHLMTERDEQRAITDSTNGYSGDSVRDEPTQTSGNSGRKKSTRRWRGRDESPQHV